MDKYEIVHVAVDPPSTLDADLTKKVAAIVHEDAYDVHLHLVGEIPRILAHCQSMHAAESIAQSLRDLGLVAFVCEDSELLKTSPSFEAHNIEFEEGGVLFRDSGGRVKRINPGNVFLILKARIQADVEKESIRTKTKLSLTTTILTGGIPIRRRVTEKTKNRSFQSECFARLYDRKLSEPSIEVLQHGIDYSFLGTEIAYSSLENFNTVVAKIRRAFPEAIFDDRLMKSYKADVPCLGVRDNLEINCKLIYLYNLARAASNRSG